MKPVCFFGAWDPGYPRNRILRAGLEHAGLEVLEVRVRERRALFRYPALARAFHAAGRASGTLLVPEFRHKDMPLARLLRGSRALVFDPLVSRHDTLVDDWELHARGSLQARWNLAIDRRALALADLVLCDTWAHGALYQTLGVPRARLERVLVGAEARFFELPPPPAAEPVTIVYVGGFLPRHGTTTIVEALARLEREPAVPSYRARLVGRGIEAEAARARARELGVTRVEFAGPVPYSESEAALATAHIALGAFGAGAKAGRVIPHKVWQALAAGRAVVTGDGDGVREVFEPERELLVVPRGDAAALAAALARLVRDAPQREGLGRCGRTRAQAVGSAAAVGASLRAALEKHGALR